MKHWLTRRLTTGFGLVVISTILLSLTGFLGQFNYLLDLTSHFKFQYLIATLVALLWFSFSRNKLWIVLALVCIGLNLFAIVPWYLPRWQLPTASAQPLRVLSVNVNVNNKNYAPTLELIRETQPDIVAIVETNWKWLNAMQTVEDFLPYSLQSPRAEGFGIALYSKFPLALEPIETFDAPKDFHLVATMNRADQQTIVIALHPPPPRDVTLFEQRNRELREIGRYIQTLNQPVIALGDLNITPWSPNYREFVDQSNLENTRKGFGVLPSWPSQLPVLSIPIDHVLVSTEIQVTNTRIGRNIGSDHLPVIADLAD